MATMLSQAARRVAITGLAAAALALGLGAGVNALRGGPAPADAGGVIIQSPMGIGTSPERPGR